MDTALKILLVEDSETDADLLIRFLHKEKIEFSHSRVWDKDGFINALNENNSDIIIADHSLPQFTGMEAFRIAKSENKNLPFILVTGTVSEKVLIEYAKEGIDDYILKENLLRLPSAIEHAMSKKKIADLHRKLEVAHKSISDSINYAKTIQNAMLPDSALLHYCFPESFVLFKPKDTLSGDFYWFKKGSAKLEGLKLESLKLKEIYSEKEIENMNTELSNIQTFFIAVADCTGHGIPGALMSMIGIEKLNSMVLRTKEPSEILNRLDKRIKTALCQSTMYEHSHDGMDIALCSINKETGILKFAGANRPLWIIRQGQKEVEEIKGNKKAIGGLTIVAGGKFDNHQIQLQKGDTFYMTSDGYGDQFGGERGKKLMTKGLKQMLLSIQELSMNEQEIFINNFMEDWKRQEEQVDDILMIGVRI